MLSKIISETNIIATQKLIDKAKKIVIITHISPDGDALGSSLGLYWLLKEIGKESRIVVPNRFPAFLDWMPDSDKIVIGSENNQLAEATILDADLLFFLDFNTINRINWLKNVVPSSKAPVVLVDHHPKPEVACSVSISHPEISSTSEIVFRLICRMGYFQNISLNSAQCLYAGMMTDTGNFSFNSQSPEIYIIIHELLKKGINKDEIYIKVFNTYSVDRIRLMGYCLYEKMKIYQEHNAAMICLSDEECRRYNYQVGDTEGFVNIPFSIKNVDLSVFVRQEGDKIKISFRSQGDFPANRMAEDFNGGGHRNAAGGESYFSMSKTISLVEAAIKNRKKYEL